MKVLSLVMIVGQFVQPSIESSPSTLQRPSGFFSSHFRQPDPPMVKSEFRANWNQHKWDSNVSHIAAGFLYNSPSQRKVRVDEAYDSTLGSSLFDYNDVTVEGVANRLWTLSPAITSQPQFFEGYVANPAFPMVSDDFLVVNNAVYRGVVNDPDAGQMTAWDIMYGGVIPTTVLVDEHGVIRGYELWDTDLRTRLPYPWIHDCWIDVLTNWSMREVRQLGASTHMASALGREPKQTESHGHTFSADVKRASFLVPDDLLSFSHLNKIALINQGSPSFG